MLFLNPMNHPRPARIAAAAFALAAVALLLASPALQADGTVHLLYFYDPECPTCEQVQTYVLEPLLAEYGSTLVVDRRSIADKDGFELLLEFERQFGVTAGAIPEVFVGSDVLIGGEQVHARLRERIEYYLGQGGTGPPAPAQSPAPSATTTPDCSDCEQIHAAQRTGSATVRTPAAPPTVVRANEPRVHVAIFFQPGCDVCERSERDLQYVTEQHPQVIVRRFNVKEEAALSQYLCVRARVPEDKYLTAPMLFVADRYLAGDDIRAPAIEALLAPYLAAGAPEPWADFDAEKPGAEAAIVDRFRSLGLLTIVGAGLIDGVNPCAFATMIFLLSYLAVRKRKGRELLLTGAAFAAGVFLTYLGVGLGLLRFLTSIPGLDVLGKWVYALTAVLCLGLAWGSFADYRKAKAGRLEDMSLKLPERMRGWSRRLIREGSGARRFVLASLLLGMVVSLIELACTGQVYLPTIIFVLGVPEWRARGGLALVVYNVMFILPLIGVFLLAYFGTTSQQLLRWMNRRASTVKLGTAVLFLLLATWLAYSIVAL